MPEAAQDLAPAARRRPPAPKAADAPAQLPAVSEAAAESAALISMIERAALNPAVDIDKMERLLAMKERIEARRAEMAFNTSLSAMATELPDIDERGSIKNNAGQVQSTYALWEDIQAVIKPILQRHGFALRFRSGLHDDGRPTVTGVLSHVAGHTDQTTLVLPIDSSGSKNNVQGIGSSTSYGQRYTAKLLLNLTSRGLDDDGKSAGMGQAAQRIVADINACDGVDELRKWKTDHYEGAAKLLAPTELAQVIELYNRRIRQARERAGQKAQGSADQ